MALSCVQIHCNLFLQEAELDFQNLKVGWIKNMIFIFKDFSMVIGVTPAYVLCAGIESLGAEVTDSCQLPGGGWKLNLSPLGERIVFLITEPSPWSQRHDSKE